MLGQYLDPIADKLLLSTMFLVLSILHKIPWKYTVLVFSRDISILCASAVLYAIAGLRDFRPSIFGKANTFAQVAAIFFVLLFQIKPVRWVWIAHPLFSTPPSPSPSSPPCIMSFWCSTACMRPRHVSSRLRHKSAFSQADLTLFLAVPLELRIRLALANSLMALRLYNTLSGKIEEFHPLDDNEVRMYACGPTVYDYGHIGNFRTFVAVDLLHRFLAPERIRRSLRHEHHRRGRQDHPQLRPATA